MTAAWLFSRWRLKRLRIELSDLLAEDKRLRDEPGRTMIDLPDQMVELGHRIAVLRYEIAELEEEADG